jgi:hypothetical protein
MIIYRAAQLASENRTSNGVLHPTDGALNDRRILRRD